MNVIFLRLLVCCCFCCLPMIAAAAAYPPVMGGAEAVVYKTVGELELQCWIYRPADAGEAPRPAIAFFFGGGWRFGNPATFAQECRYLASRGMIAISVDYRIKSRHGTGIQECIRDAISAMRFLRANAARLGIDPQRLAAGGGSAGGHLAAAAALLSGFDEPGDDTAISPRPDALILHYPALAIAPIEGLALSADGERYMSGWNRFCVPLSPYHHLSADAPPTLIFHGDADNTVPHEFSVAYVDKARSLGGSCELVTLPGQGHNLNGVLAQVLRRTDAFLVELGYLSGSDAVDAFLATDGG